MRRLHILKLKVDGDLILTFIRDICAVAADNRI